MSRPTPLPTATTLTATLTAALAAILFLSACPNRAQADLVYRPNEGWSREGGFFGSSAAVAKTADLQIQYAADLEKKGDMSGARDAYKKLVKVFPLAQQAAEARFKLAGLLEKQGRYEDAFESYDELVVKHPDSKEFTLALEAMYAIGKRYMNGERRRLFGLKTFSSNQRAEEMFETILKRAPYSRSAAQVMLFRGMMMERQGKDIEALAAYQQVIERFPTDPIADDAQYQMGYIRLRNVKDGSYNNTDRIRAQESFEDYLNRAPKNEKTNQVRENLQTIENSNRKAALDIAKFYEKMGKIRAAVISYEDVVRDHPNSPEADFAKKRIGAIKSEKGEEAAVNPGSVQDAGTARKQAQAKINTTSRPDYVGPRLKQEAVAQRPKPGPALRLQDADAAAPPLPADPSSLDLRLPAPRLTPPSPQNP